MTNIYVIRGRSVDELVYKGIQKISNHGYRILDTTSGGDGLQLANVHFILSNSRNRIHYLRSPESVRYFANEIILYFSGTTDVYNMVKASKAWLRNADEDGQINSNYGKYVFHTIPAHTPDHVRNQYQWCRELLLKKNSRKATIDIMHIDHHGGQDLPCTFGIHFIIDEFNNLNCIGNMRSTDVITRLPFDIGFFSILNELLCQDLREHGREVNLGYTMITTNLSQNYDMHSKKVEKIYKNRKTKIPKIVMPKITSAKELLEDIRSNLVGPGYQAGNIKSDFMKWCFQYSKFGL